MCIHQHHLIMVPKGSNTTRLGFKRYPEILIENLAFISIKLNWLFLCQRLQRCRRPIQLELIVSHFRSSRHKGLVFLGFHRETDKKLLTRMPIDTQTLNVNLLCSKWFNIQIYSTLLQGFFCREDLKIAIEG